MLAEIQIKNAAKLKYIYRLIILMDDSQGLSDEQKINWAFREDDNEESVKKGMELYTAYFFGGLEILYDEFVNNCITDDDYLLTTGNMLLKHMKNTGKKPSIRNKK